jgi:hypothetical protein
VTSAEERIKELARTKALDDADAARLLEAVGARPDGALRGSVLENPFARYGGEVTAVVGLVVSVLSLLVARLGVRFDGAFDVHTTSVAVPLPLALRDQLVAFPVTAIVFSAIAWIAARRVRIVDVVGVVGASRAPSTFLAVPLALLSRLAPGPAAMTPALAVLLVIALTGFGAQIYLLVVGFRTVTGLRGGRLAGWFVAAVLLAEIVSKLLVAL